MIKGANGVFFYGNDFLVEIKKRIYYNLVSFKTKLR